MDIVDLRYLLVAANTGNLSRAAEFLGLRTSNLSRRIARLEDDLGVTPFERGQFGICLTGSGRVILVHAKRMPERTWIVLRREPAPTPITARLGTRQPHRRLRLAPKQAC